MNGVKKEVKGEYPCSVVARYDSTGSNKECRIKIGS